jgi:hypothetical protein
MAEPILMKFGMCIVALEPIPIAYFINLPSVCVSICVFPPVIARQWLGKNVTAAINKHHNKRRIVGSVVFCVVNVIPSKVGN